MKTTFIYVLKCPLSGEVRYVGKTNNPKERYKNHLNKAKDGGTHKRNWIGSLRKKGLKPVFETIKEVFVSEWKDWEKYCIGYYRDKGYKLVNFMGGGEGLTFGNQTSFKKGAVPWNKGIKQKIIKKCAYELCGNKFSPEDSRRKFCSRSCAAKAGTGFKKGHVPWTKGRKDIISSRKGRKLTLEVKQKIAKTLKGRFNMGNSRPILQLDKNTCEIINEFPSAAEAGRMTNIDQSRIINNTNGYSNTAGGFKWKKKGDL